MFLQILLARFNHLVRIAAAGTFVNPESSSIKYAWRPGELSGAACQASISQLPEYLEPPSGS
jgi:hypothetical protein